MIDKHPPEGVRQLRRLPIHGFEAHETAAAMGPWLGQGADADWRRRRGFYSRTSTERESIEAAKVRLQPGPRRTAVQRLTREEAGPAGEAEATERRGAKVGGAVADCRLHHRRLARAQRRPRSRRVGEWNAVAGDGGHVLRACRGRVRRATATSPHEGLDWACGPVALWAMYTVLLSPWR